MRFKLIYMDNGATTKIDENVLKSMMPYFTEKYANPSSSHSFGQDAKDAVDKARGRIAKAIGADEHEIFFTSGGTESNNWALKGLAFAAMNAGKIDASGKKIKSGEHKNHIITTKIEHKSILNVCEWLKENAGFETTYLDVDKDGFVNPEDIKKAITKKTLLVSIIHGNNEVGTIQDIETIGNICKNAGVLFHTDVCQSFTKTLVDVQKQNIDLLTLNAHKVHGPKGIGALFIRKGVEVMDWQQGGNHEKGMRSGTENVHGIVGFGEAVKIAMKDVNKNVKHMILLRDKLIKVIMDNVENVKLNGYYKEGNSDKRLCNNVNFSFLAIEGESLGGYLDQKFVCSSTGSACNARNLEPSYVLKAMELTDEEANGSLRLTLSKFNTEEEIDYVAKTIPKIVEKLRHISPIGKVVNYFKKK
ncbi:cysteine desulfurase [Candidatus Woesearchaeota archaeon]|jgi:cysteine desulfurase|nr:cysteine desulfurase [Candidatus Woesearchaeota archaeon]